jgi:amidase
VTELVDRSAVELAAMIRRREVSARELLTASLQRIELMNPQLNAIVTLVPEMAEVWAAAADERTASGATLGPLHGLPIAHKDLEPTAGIRTTMGSPLLSEFVPAEDGLIVQRFRRAGAVTIGKTNVPEFGAGSHTFNPVFGATLNPYDPTKTCGGSSGGAAVALATGMIPIADGSDMGGSLRNPASFCNIVGLRPSAGRVPSWPNRTPWSSLSTSGAMGRSVDDVALQMQAISGPDRRVPIALAESGSIFADLAEIDLGDVRVAWSPDLGLPVEQSVRDALSDVPDRLEALGCTVDVAMPDLTGAREIFQVLRAWSFEISYGSMYDRSADRLKDTIRWNIEEARRLTLVDHARASAAHAALVVRASAFFERYDVLALPTSQVVPFDVDLDWPRVVDGTSMDTYIDWMRSCSDISVTGCPAISMPSAFTTDGLPVGVQFVGRPGGDVDLLRFARTWERAGVVSPPRATVATP